MRVRLSRLRSKPLHWCSCFPGFPGVTVMPQPPQTWEGCQDGQGTWDWEEEEGAPAAAGAPASSGRQQQEWTAAPGASWGNWGRHRDRGHRGDPDPAPAAEEEAGSRLSRPVARAPVRSSGQKPGHFSAVGQGAGAGSRGTAIQGGDGAAPPMHLDFDNAPPPHLGPARLCPTHSAPVHTVTVSV